jgi:hypothetical protein
MSANEHQAFREQLLAYCRENNLPPPTGDQLFLHKDDTALLLVGDAAASSVAVWAELGKTGEFRDEETLLATILEVASQLNPLHGVFVGLDAHSQRIMLRTKFSMSGGDASKALADFVAGTARKVKEIKGLLHEDLNR